MDLSRDNAFGGDVDFNDAQCTNTARLAAIGSIDTRRAHIPTARPNEELAVVRVLKKIKNGGHFNVRLHLVKSKIN